MAVYKINESKKVTESYRDGMLSIDQLREAISNLEELVSEMEINNISSVKASPNTYGLGSFFLGTSSGYINLSDVYRYIPDGEDDEEDEEYESLKEATGLQNYRVVSVTMDVALPANKSLDDYGTDSSRGSANLYRALSGALESVGLKMAGDYVDAQADHTDVYKDNDYAFEFEESLKEDITETPIEDIDKFTAEVKERFPGSEVIFDGDTNTIKITLDDKKEEESVKETPEESTSDVKEETLTPEYTSDLLDMAQMSFETGVRFDEGDFEDSEDFDKYQQLIDLGPAGFYEEYKDTLDFDPDFVAEYGVEEESLKESDSTARNFTVEDADGDIVDYQANSAKEAIERYKKDHPNSEILSVYDEGDIYYDIETGDELED